MNATKADDTTLEKMPYPDRALELITQLQASYAVNADDAARRLGGAAQFVASPDLSMWAHGAALKKELGGEALFDIGFINALESTTEVRDAAIAGFLKWTEGLNVPVDLPKRLQRALNGEKEKPFRLLIWPGSLTTEQSLGTISVEEMDGHHDNYADFGAQFLEGVAIEKLINTHSRASALAALAREAWGAGICYCCKAEKTGTGSPIRPTLQMHHLTPISEGQRFSTVYDLRPVCPTCHVELHLGGQARSIKELQASR